ncbi:MAG TPA: hypothetical protein DCW72_00875 [Elusimicrobia bacterium]|nr:hypothetical protein [Elusimicrobiota bacterium]
MGGQQGGQQLQRRQLFSVPHGAQHLQLRVQAEAVAALHLGGGGAAGEKARGALRQLGGHGLRGLPAHGAYARHYPPAGGLDLLVGSPGRAHGEILQARLGEDHVRVAVHEAGQADAAGLHYFRLLGQAVAGHGGARPGGFDDTGLH